jgi:hypothetical protein
MCLVLQISWFQALLDSGHVKVPWNGKSCRLNKYWYCGMHCYIKRVDLTYCTPVCVCWSVITVGLREMRIRGWWTRRGGEGSWVEGKKGWVVKREIYPLGVYWTSLFQSAKDGAWMNCLRTISWRKHYRYVQGKARLNLYSSGTVFI